MSCTAQRSYAFRHFERLRSILHKMTVLLFRLWIFWNCWCVETQTELVAHASTYLGTTHRQALFGFCPGSLLIALKSTGETGDNVIRFV